MNLVISKENTINLKPSDLENFSFYVEDRDFGHVIANFTLANKQYSAFLQLPDSPDSEHKLMDKNGTEIDYSYHDYDDEFVDDFIDWKEILFSLCIKRIEDAFEYWELKYDKAH